jgi:hypothetical protein
VPTRNAVADACFKVVPPKPPYIPPRPCSCQMVHTAFKADLKRLSCLVSSIRAALMRSVGVTVVMLATMLALIPASMLR